MLSLILRPRVASSSWSRPVEVARRTALPEAHPHRLSDEARAGHASRVRGGVQPLHQALSQRNVHPHRRVVDRDIDQQRDYPGRERNALDRRRLGPGLASIGDALQMCSHRLPGGAQKFSQVDRFHDALGEIREGGAVAARRFCSGQGDEKNCAHETHIRRAVSPRDCVVLRNNKRYRSISCGTPIAAAACRKRTCTEKALVHGISPLKRNSPGLATKADDRRLIMACAAPRLLNSRVVAGR
jgi:hypothetical protein